MVSGLGALLVRRPDCSLLVHEFKVPRMWCGPGVVSNCQTSCIIWFNQQLLTRSIDLKSFSADLPQISQLIEQVLTSFVSNVYRGKALIIVFLPTVVYSLRHAGKF